MLIKKDLSDYLRTLLRLYSVVSITGSGGKTALMGLLGKMYKKIGVKTMLSATYPLNKGFDYGADEVITGPISYKGSNSVLYIRESDEGDYLSPGDENISLLSRYFSKVIIESDVSNGFSLNYHTPNDPVLAKASQVVLIVVGIDCLGQKIEDVMFNCDEYFQEFPLRKGQRVDIIDLENLFISKNGIFKLASSGARHIFLNKFDALDSPLFVKKITNFAFTHNCTLTSFEKNEFIYDNIL